MSAQISIVCRSVGQPQCFKRILYRFIFFNFNGNMGLLINSYTVSTDVIYTTLFPVRSGMNIVSMCNDTYLHNVDHN